ncbi:MAG: hypothetical protein ACHQ15_01515 [Candidatus Limnocylindrales bacterium]
MKSSWTLTWGNTAPYDVYFRYDVNGPVSWSLTGTSTTSKGLSHTFLPCTTTIFTQTLEVYDAHGYALDYSTAQEGGSPYC